MANRYLVRLRAWDSEDPEKRKTIEMQVVENQADLVEAKRKLYRDYADLLDGLVIEVEEVF